MRWCLTVVLICISLIVMLNIVLCGCRQSECLLRKNIYLDSLPMFWIELLAVLLLRCLRDWYVLDINSLPSTWFANIFCHSVGCFVLFVFYFADGILCCPEALYLLHSTCLFLLWLPLILAEPKSPHKVWHQGVLLLFSHLVVSVTPWTASGQASL